MNPKYFTKRTKLSLAIGLIGAVTGCGGGSDAPVSNTSASTPVAQTSLSLDLFGARGGTITAVTTGTVCSSGEKISWANSSSQSLATVNSIDDPNPADVLTATISCGATTQSLTLAPRNVFGGSSVFAVIKPDQTLAIWGSKRLGGDSTVLAKQPTHVINVAMSERATAILQDDGTLVTLGRSGSGGNYSKTPGIGLTDLSSPTQAVFNVNKVWAVKRGFVAQNVDGSVATWGNLDLGSDIAAMSSYITAPTLAKMSNFTDVAYNNSSVAALRKDGTVVTWGHPYFGGDSGAVQSQLTSVTKLVATEANMAALKNDGSVVFWGVNWDTQSLYDGTESLPKKVANLLSNSTVLATLQLSGAVQAFGNYLTGRGSDTKSVAAALSGNVSKVIANEVAFAALKTDGSVVTWGEAERNDASAVQSQLNGVKAISNTALAFAALKTDGTVVAWGDETRGGDISAVKDQLVNVVAIYANDFAFAALKADGSVVTWGGTAQGGDNTNATAPLKNVRAIYSAKQGGFLAVTKDGSVVTWGSASAGGALPKGQLSNIAFFKS